MYQSSVRRLLSISIFKWLLIWSHGAEFHHISHIASIGSRNEYFIFLFLFFNRIGILVAVEIDSFHWLIIENVEIVIYWRLITAYFSTKVLQTCALRSPLHYARILSKLLNLIWYYGNQNINFAKKKKKKKKKKRNPLLRSHVGNEAETLQNCS